MLASQERHGSPYVLALLGDNSHNSLGYQGAGDSNPNPSSSSIRDIST